MATKGTNQPDDAAWAAAKNHRPKYSKPVVDYAATFGVTERGLKKWIEKSREDWIASGCPTGGPDFPPFDQPDRMLGWWQVHMERRPSTTLLSLAGQSAATTSTPSPPGDKPPADATPTAQIRTAINLDTIGEMDLASAAKAQRKIVAAALQAYQEALSNPKTPEPTITLLGKRCDSAVERLRVLEKSLSAAEIERGDRPHINDVRAELAPLLQALAVGFVELLIERIGIPRQRARELADEWFRTLEASRFGTVVIESAQPTPAAA